MKREYFDFRGLRLSYLHGGPPGAPLFFFCHANGYAAGCYQYYMRRLLGEYRVAALDFSGHGHSEDTLDFETWDIFRDQVLSLLDRLGVGDGEVVGVGHSLGGSTLARAAAARPAVFKRLVLLDPVLLGYTRVAFLKVFGNPLAKISRTRRRQFKHRAHTARAMRRLPGYNRWHPEIFFDYMNCCFHPIEGDKLEGLRLACPPETEVKIFETADFGSVSRFYKLAVPCTIVIPRRHEVCPPGVARRVIRNHPQSRLVVDELDHLFPFEIPEWTLKKILE